MTALAFLVAACPLLSPAAGAAGQTEVSPSFPAQALTLNAEGKALYRQGRFEEARARYRAALAAAPEFLGPALNVACSFARQERFAEAAEAAAALVRDAYVPGAREVLEAADLAVLHVRPEMETLRAAVAEAAGAWGRAVAGGLLFVARTKPPIRLAGEGVLVLGMGQEIFAWLPETGRYRQVTAEDGRLLAFARSPDGRRVFYVRGGKLVRVAGRPPTLRGLSLRRLEIPTMSLGPALDLPDDVTRVELRVVGSHAEVRLVDATGARRLLRSDGAALTPGALAPPRGHPPVVLTPAGVEPARTEEGPAGCRFQAEDHRPADALPGVRIRTRGRSAMLAARYGAGLYGMPFAARGRP